MAVDLKCKHCGNTIQQEVKTYKGVLYCKRCKTTEQVNVVTASSLWEQAWQR